MSRDCRITFTVAPKRTSIAPYGRRRWEMKLRSLISCVVARYLMFLPFHLAFLVFLVLLFLVCFVKVVADIFFSLVILFHTPSSTIVIVFLVSLVLLSFTVVTRIIVQVFI
jgi:hypothetical protein